jgi:response regulator NasT
LEVAMARFREQMALRAEKEALNQTLENRKIIERAKGILMKRLNLPEPDAHKKLQQESQKRRVSVIDLAKKIVESEETLSGF